MAGSAWRAFAAKRAKLARAQSSPIVKAKALANASQPRPTAHAFLHAKSALVEMMAVATPAAPVRAVSPVTSRASANRPAHAYPTAADAPAVMMAATALAVAAMTVRPATLAGNAATPARAAVAGATVIARKAVAVVTAK